MPLDLALLRVDTPGTSNRNHLNNAGAALMARPVLDAMTAYLQREAEIGGYEAAAEADQRLDGVYDSVAAASSARIEPRSPPGERHGRLADGLLRAEVPAR